MKGKSIKRLNQLVCVKHLGSNLAESVNVNCYYLIYRDEVNLFPVSPHKNERSIKAGVILFRPLPHPLQQLKNIPLFGNQPLITCPSILKGTNGTSSKS